MLQEQKELYTYIKDHFIEDLKRISSECVAPLIAVRQVVKKSMESYCKNYCTVVDNPFAQEDFQNVSIKIYKEIMKNEL